MSDQLPAEEVDDRPWERPGVVRRDCEPHRGLLLSVLGGTSLAVAALFICVPAAGLLTLPAAIATYTLARRDLEQMEAGRMDPAGQRQARRAKARAIAGMWVSGLNLLFTVGLLIHILFG